MAVLINWKICDNAKECNGPSVCPTDAIYWDLEKKSLAIDNSKCTSCGLCEPSCPVGAIRVARTDEEFNRIKREIEADPRTVAELFVDRYGAAPIDPRAQGFSVDSLETNKLLAVELFKNETIHCLLTSIPIRELLGSADVGFRKAVADDELLKRYDIKQLPALLFFKDRKLVGKIEGYYSEDQKDEFKKKVDGIINKVNA